jgi:V/A-type H+-transporting ATPase subunit E
MNTKLQELTDKIYQEGVEKGNAEAQTIVENAQSQADSIIAQAKADAEKIVAEAQAKSAELDKNTKSELRLFAGQSINALKTEITDLICGAIVADSVKSAVADKAFMQKMILALVQDWAKTDHLTIETKDAQALTDYFTANAKNLLDKGLKITEVNGIKTDFAIVSETKGYKITLGEEELTAYFKEFLRPKLVEMLF